MALEDLRVTIVDVAEPQDKLYSITLNLLVDDDEVGYDGINQNFTFDCNQGANVSAKELQVIAVMQEAIDRYKSSKAVQKSAALRTAVNNIRSGLSAK